MTFEFIIACRAISVTDVRQGLTDLLARVLQDNLNEFDTDVIDQMIQFRHARDGKRLTDDSGATTLHILIGFTLELPEETTSAKAVVQEFASELPDTPPIFHAVKFEDPLLRDELAKRAEEIFALEMKLRRVLSLIYLHAYQSEEPFKLLCDETVKPIGNPKPKRMKEAGENQFFHLTFGNYAILNQRPKYKVEDLRETLRDVDTYDKFLEFRNEFDRTPIEHEVDAGLLAGLKERMGAIEGMRNCVAHNRRPGTRLTDNYDNALPRLHELLDNYLFRWELYSKEEMPWDRAAREAVEHQMETAIWETNTETILFGPYGDNRDYETISNLEELKRYLREVAVSAFHDEVRYAGALGPATQCDEYGIVESVLYDYKERLAEFL